MNLSYELNKESFCLIISPGVDENEICLYIITTCPNIK